jgi:ectoine hydroxylase-related dioxygenase (phytanoyl-CoA dioxygenase family)
MISSKDVRFYRQQGYLVIEDVLSAAELAVLRGVIDAWVEQSRGVGANDEFFDLEDTHSADVPKVRRFKSPDLYHESFLRLVDHPVIMDTLQNLWGAGVRFSKSKLNMKIAGCGAAVEWHQDWAFYPHTNDDLAAVGFMIDDMTPDNGAMMVIPGSHKGPVYNHHADGAFCGAVDTLEQGIDTSGAKMLTGRAGSVTIHHVRTLHASAPNRSGAPRRFLLHQYEAADAWPLLGIDDYESFKAGLVRGEEVAAPRMEALPVRLPYPQAPHEGSIYENQRTLARRFFDDAQAPVSAAKVKQA